MIQTATAPRVRTPKPRAPASIYERALGPERFARLHPKIRERFGFDSTHRRASVGRGVMEELWRGPFYTLPFLAIGTFRHILFPERGRDIPFQIENYAYVDQFGRETVTWVRTFETRKVRRFDATMIYSESRDRIVDYLGSHQHLAVDLAVDVSERGGIRFTSGEQRFYEGPMAFRFPMLFTGVANVHEWFDDDRGQYGIEVEVTNKRWGPLFGYRGHFDAEILTDIDADDVPQHVRPVREEPRE